MPNTTENETPRAGILATLRQMVPNHPLTHREALVVAERQSTRLRELLGVTTTTMPDEALMAIPRTKFVTAADLPASGGSHWQERHWLIVINATEPYTRQRFSAAHELFHVIAHPRLGSLTPGWSGRNPHREGEHLADYFAGVLLVPRDQLTRLWAQGTRQLHELADAFTVSERAIEVRLDQLGLTGARQRCWAQGANTAHDGAPTISPLRAWKAAA